MTDAEEADRWRGSRRGDRTLRGPTQRGMSKPNYPLGSLDLEIDRAGNVWVGMMYQASVARFDRKTETMQVFAIPAEWQKGASVSQQVTATNVHVDGKVWVKSQEGNQILRLEPATGTWENLGAFKGGVERHPFLLERLIERRSLCRHANDTAIPRRNAVEPIRCLTAPGAHHVL